MRQLIAAITAVGLAVATAHGGVGTTISYVKTATVATAAGPVIVDVYDIIQTATGTDPNSGDYLLGAICLGIGTGDDPNLNPQIGDDPFQIWNDGYDPNAPGSMSDYWTATYNNTARIEDIGDNRRADTRFLPPGMEAWVPAILYPFERNDERYGLCTGSADDKAGLGEIYVATAVPVANRAHSITVLQVGVVQGTTVYGRFDSADGWGGETHEHNVLIPEPATLSLLGLGALAMLRRRR